jgi:MFS family permease
MIGQPAQQLICAMTTIETRRSWHVAFAATAIITVAFGAPFVVIVGLKPIAAGLDVPRSVPSLANSLAWLGTGVGGLFMGYWAERAGVFRTVLIGSLMVAAGAMVASLGTVWQLYLGHGLMIGLLGNAGIFAPLITYVTRWFDRQRGVALSLVSSGQQVSGAVWPPVLRFGIDHVGWQWTLCLYGALVLIVLPPLCLLVRHPPPAPLPGTFDGEERSDRRVLGFPGNLALGLLGLAIFCCCTAMAMPMGHLVAYCSDLGFAPARGAEMLALLLGSAFLSRIFWGRLADRIGGLPTVFAGVLCQAIGLALFLPVRDLATLYVLAAAFGLGFGGIVPSYVYAVREHFPASGAGWRIGAVLFCGLSGMAFGNWLAGALYDYFAFYQPAFAAGVAFNLVTVLLIGSLLPRRHLAGPRSPVPQPS